jgi:hypothetical protein
MNKTSEKKVIPDRVGHGVSNKDVNYNLFKSVQKVKSSTPVTSRELFLVVVNFQHKIQSCRKSSEVQYHYKFA